MKALDCYARTTAKAMITRESLDLRRLAVWERTGLVLERADELSTGGSLEFLTDINPRALMGRLEQLRPGQLAFAHRHVGSGDWHVTLTRVHVEEGASSLAAALLRNPVFSKLSDPARSTLSKGMMERTARKGDVICGENAPCNQFGVLLEGSLAVFVGAGSRERLLFHLYPFDIFGDVEFFDRGLAVGRTVVLSKNARYATVPYDTIEEIGMRDPHFFVALAAGVSQHTRTLASALAAQVSKPILARVASALLPYAAPERALHPALPPLSTMTQAQVAAAAGTVKEVAARAIAELERVQALRRERGHIRYLDRVKLLEVIDRS
jgi:uncharacterized protein (DUF2249 family)/CRP-like cAMP-binding protein